MRARLVRDWHRRDGGVRRVGRMRKRHGALGSRRAVVDGGRRGLLLVGLQGGYLSLLLTYHVQETVLSRVSSVYVVRMPCSIRLGPPAHTPAPGAALPD